MSFWPHTWEDIGSFAGVCVLVFGCACYVARLSLKGMFVTKPEHKGLETETNRRLNKIEADVRGLATSEQLSRLHRDNESKFATLERKVVGVDASVLVLRADSEHQSEKLGGIKHQLDIVLQHLLRERFPIAGGVRSVGGERIEP